jgi:hypothetical protein
MFAKLNLDWKVKNYEYGNKIVDYGIHFKDGKIVPKIIYHVASGQCEELLKKLIPNRYQKDFSVAVMDITASVGAHTDSEILVSINHYIQTNDERTIFYKPKNEVVITTSQVKNQTNGVVFSAAQLDVYGMFTAKEDETWILDVSKPHSVESVRTASKLRKAIVLQTVIHPYDQVVEMLKETNSL